MMDALVVYAVIAVLTFKASSVNGNLNITQSGSNKIGSTTYILACHITGYSGLATWDRGATGIGQCPVGGCLASTDSRYNFRNDAGAIYVDFLKLTADEDGIVWTCQHGLDPADVFTVEVDTSPTATTEMPLTSTSIDQTSIPHDPNIDKSYTRKTVITITTTADNGLTSWSPVVTSEVTSIKTVSDNSTELNIEAIIAIVISAVIFLFLIVMLVNCCCRCCRKNYKRKLTSEKCHQKSTKAKEEQNHKDLHFKRNPIITKHCTEEMKCSSEHVTNDDNQQSTECDRRLTEPSYYPSEYHEFKQYMPNHIVNINDRYRISDPFQNNKRQIIPSPYRPDNESSFRTRYYNDYKRTSPQRNLYSNEIRGSQGFFFDRDYAQHWQF